MYKKNKKYLLLISWIFFLIGIGSLSGLLINPEINTWYHNLNRSPLTPPDYVFSIVWTVLYGIIGLCGWLMWQARAFSKLKTVKILYVAQLLLNWSWTPIFFYYHHIGFALFILICLDIVVGMLIWKSYPELKMATFLMFFYLLWILCATYLNFYIWWHN